MEGLEGVSNGRIGGYYKGAQSRSRGAVRVHGSARCAQWVVRVSVRAMIRVKREIRFLVHKKT